LSSFLIAHFMHFNATGHIKDSSHNPKGNVMSSKPKREIYTSQAKINNIKMQTN